MPTYEYRCKACGQELEVVQSFTDDALTTCEACGGQLRKVFGNVGIAFKGSGFYKNDSRGKSTASRRRRATRAAASAGSARQGAVGDDGPDSAARTATPTRRRPERRARAPTRPPKADKAKAELHHAPDAFRRRAARR